MSKLKSIHTQSSEAERSAIFKHISSTTEMDVHHVQERPVRASGLDADRFENVRMENFDHAAEVPIDPTQAEKLQWRETHTNESQSNTLNVLCSRSPRSIRGQMFENALKFSTNVTSVCVGIQFIISELNVFGLRRVRDAPIVPTCCRRVYRLRVPYRFDCSIPYNGSRAFIM